MLLVRIREGGVEKNATSVNLYACKRRENVWIISWELDVGRCRTSESQHHSVSWCAMQLLCFYFELSVSQCWDDKCLAGGGGGVGGHMRRTRERRLLVEA